jgi:hypothetical protein
LLSFLWIWERIEREAGETGNAGKVFIKGENGRTVMDRDSGNQSIYGG